MIPATTMRQYDYLPSFASAFKHTICIASVLFFCGCRLDSDNTSRSALNAPYSLEIATPKQLSRSSEDCRQAPVAPIQDLVLGSVYRKTDPTRAEIDEDAKKIYQEQTYELNSFTNRLSVLSNDYLKSAKQDQRAATCALEWLYIWAEGRAFLGKINVQGTYARQWGLATLSSSYLQVRDHPGYDQDKKQVIENWLSQIARHVMDEYADMDKYVRKQNNHLYWAAWGVTITGIATGERELYEWGVGKIKYALHVQLQEDGTLPLEMMRGKKALQYHVFALAPLVMVCEAAMQNGENLYEINDGAIHSLISRVFEGLQDPSYFEEKTGYAQIPAEAISGVHFSWLEVYNARFPDEKTELFLKKYRPVISRRTGGDMTFLYVTI